MDIEIEAENILWGKQNPEKAAKDKEEWEAYKEAIEKGDWKAAHDRLKKKWDELKEIILK